MKNNIQPENRVLTIPNLLSAFRLLLIPLFVWLYLQEKYFYTGLVLLISGITDISDGFIARTLSYGQQCRESSRPGCG